MQHVTGERWASAAAATAAVVAALGGLAGAVALTQWDPGPTVLLVGAVVAGVAAAAAAGWSWRNGDRVLFTAAVSVLAYALSWVAPGVLVTVVVVVAQGALLASGVRTIRSARGTRRALGWTAAIAAALWFVSLLSLSTPLLVALPQDSLGVTLSLPYLFQTLGYLAAAALVAGPLLRPVGAGARSLWSSAEVR